MLEGHFAREPHSGCRSWRCSTRASGWIGVARCGQCRVRARDTNAAALRH